jgi:hypothetical protein
VNRSIFENMPDDKLIKLHNAPELSPDDVLTLYNAAFDRNETEYNAVMGIEITALAEIEILSRWKKGVEINETVRK